MIEHTITLPLGLVLKGRVVDQATGQGVAKALSISIRRRMRKRRTLFALSMETGPDGTFRLVVPPGRGTYSCAPSKAVSPARAPVHRATRRSQG